jgi:SPOR domain
MFLRVLCLLLLALNIGVASWLYFAPPSQADELPVSDPGVPRLVLLAENERAGDSSAELSSAPEANGDISQDICLSLGPFPTQADLRAAINSLTSVVKRIQFREVRSTQARGYWVFVPAMANREQALGVARQLSGKGVRDYYVVTAGDQQNTISLGLFRDQGNAEKRRSEIAAMGFDAQLMARTEELPVYFVDFAQDQRHAVDWRTRLSAPPEIKQQTVACF